MNPERWRRVEEILHDVEARDPGQRAAFLEQACAGDEALRCEVESLLAQETAAESFMEHPSWQAASGLTAGRRLGPYEVGPRIGAGGMGEVWRARDTRLERDVALKVLPTHTIEDRTAHARLLREARLASRLNHPNICTIHEIGEVDGQPYIAMELIEGRPLSERLVDGPLPVEQTLRYGQQLAAALAHAHGRSVMHRDLKSANVVVTPEDQVKVLDFGLAKRLTGAELIEATTVSKDSLTAPGTVAGTLAYMAPEQLRGGPADARSDIWALGVVLYEMAGGRRPFEGQTGFELSSAILKDAPPPLPAEVLPTLSTVIERCLTKEPGGRYQSATEVRAALEAVQSGSPVAARPALATSADRRRRLLAGAGALAAFLVLAAVLVAFNVGGLRGRLLGSAGPARTIRLAVLPFANLTGDAAQEYLSDGLTQEMIAQLGRLHPESLSVIARTSVMRYKKSTAPVSQIARDLGVDYILEGSARREAGRVRVTAELIKVLDQTQLWADTYERELAGILILQSDVARSVSRALALKLLPAEQARLNVRTVNPDAYEAYLKGSQHWGNLTPGELDIAQQYFDLALKKDPNYAPAYAGLAIVWASRQQMGFTDPREAGPKAKAAALEAVALDDTNADAHTALANILTWTDWNWSAGEREFQRAITLNPNLPDPRVYYSHLLNAVGHPKEAMIEIDRALAVDPLNVIFRCFYAIDLVYARRWDEAMTEGRAVLRTSPDNPVALAAIWYAAARNGEDKEAFAAAHAVIKASYADAEVNLALERGYAQGGYVQGMRHCARALAARFDRAYANPTDIASLYAEGGENGLALDWLEKGFEVHDANMPYIGAPIYDRLRSEPRYLALCRRMNLPVR